MYGTHLKCGPTLVLSKDLLVNKVFKVLQDLQVRLVQQVYQLLDRKEFKVLRVLLAFVASKEQQVISVQQVFKELQARKALLDLLVQAVFKVQLV